MAFKVITDGSCDLSDELVAKNDIEVVPFYVSMDEKTYLKEKKEIGVLDFYKQMVDNPNIFPKTSMPTVNDFYEVFEKYAEAGMDMICICITTKFSGSYNSASSAKEDILKNYPNVKIEVIDATINTCIQGLLVLEVARMNKNGVSFEKAIKYTNIIKKTARIFFTIGSMDYLRHGGRIGKLKGLIAATLKIKPLIVLKEGEIFSEGVAFTKNQSIVKVFKNCVKHFIENKIDYHDYNFIIGTGINQEDYPILKDKLHNAFPDADLPFGQIGATIGVHTGPYPIGVGIIKRYDV